MRIIKVTNLFLGALAVTVGTIVLNGGSVSSGSTKSFEAEVKADASKVLSEEQIGLRDTTLYDESKALPSKTNYAKNPAGSGVKYERAFQDAPPMIPHDTEGMLPITKNMNQCVSCHMPEVAKAMGATAIPKSHFTDFRPKHSFDGKNFKKSVDNMKNDVVIVEETNLVAARYNCSQCHAPQSQGEAPLNVFSPEFESADGKYKSSWVGEKYLDGLDTLNE